MFKNEITEHKEVLDRLRRIETRLTKFMEFQGFDTNTKKPVWSGGILTLPSLDCSLRQALACVPPGYKDEICLRAPGGEVIGYFYLGED